MKHLPGIFFILFYILDGGSATPVNDSQLLPIYPKCGSSLNNEVQESPWTALIEFKYEFITDDEDFVDKNLCRAALLSCVGKRRRRRRNVPSELNDIPKRGHFKCAGNLITSKYVLTSAHCVMYTGDYQPISVRVGAYDLAAPENCQKRSRENTPCLIQDIDIETIDVHEDYMHDIPENFLEAGQNDIALLRLQHETVVNDNVRPICLPVAQELQSLGLVGKNLLLTGWGVTENGPVSSLKTTTQVLVVDNKSCADAYITKRISSQHICVKSSNSSTCLDDSGSGLVYSSKVGSIQVNYLLGLSSYKPNCENEIPVVYTIISDYVTWIVSKID